MTELRFDDPCLLFALGREPIFSPRVQAQSTLSRRGPVQALLRPRLAVSSGRRDRDGPRGNQRRRNGSPGPPTLDKVAYRPKLVLSVGFCGALKDGLNVGDVVLATEVVDEAGNVWPATWPGPLPPGKWEPRLHLGRIVTTDHLINDAAEKRRFGERHQALAVDMEAAEVVPGAATAKFLAVRCGPFPMR